ncbi:nucleotidyltransferase domain-containing protein [Dyadobacter aurulentus]|uniref:nucleotidyltransferase domain-containing protein n=1 Tax=Dyadobacter sp. UC 10 TaxID=2605428 RepID=UPI0011F32895|nr:nucleotidyltransferase family protein [Dyadobacter sp. UC 10]KAA0989418.1 nucleotidyltransferase family protein [Dyadobacter sp. UC 10]
MKLSPEMSILIKASLGDACMLPFPVSKGKVSWKKLRKQAKWNQVRPLLLENLPDPGTGNQASAVVADLKEFSVGQAVTNMAFSGISVHLYNQLADNGISAFLMKGALWAWMLYEKPHLREFGDIDFFVAKDDIKGSLEVFAKNGFEPDSYRHYLLNEKDTSNAYLNTDYQLPLTPVEENTLQSLEIQWNCSYPRYLFNFTWEELCDGMIEYEIMGTPMRIPKMENQFLMMLVHHAGVEQWDKLKYMADFIRLLRLSADSLDWGYITSTARSKGFYNIVMESLGVASVFTGQDYTKWADPSQSKKYPSEPFLSDILMHWEDERASVKTKSLRILSYNLQYRDNLKTKSAILGAHIEYMTHWRLLWNKWVWYRGKASPVSK